MFFIFIKIFSITFNYAVLPSVWRKFYLKLHCDHETLFQNKWLFPHIPLLVFYLISLRQRLSSWFAEYFYSSIFETNNTGEISPLNIWWTLEGTTSCLYQVKQLTVFISRSPRVRCLGNCQHKCTLFQERVYNTLLWGNPESDLSPIMMEKYSKYDFDFYLNWYCWQVCDKIDSSKYLIQL